MGRLDTNTPPPIVAAVIVAAMLALLPLGWTADLGHALPLAEPLVFALYIGRFQNCTEERALEQVFGEHFTRYAAHVRPWL